MATWPWNEPARTLQTRPDRDVGAARLTRLTPPVNPRNRPAVMAVPLVVMSVNVTVSSQHLVGFNAPSKGTYR